MIAMAFEEQFTMIDGSPALRKFAEETGYLPVSFCDHVDPRHNAVRTISSKTNFLSDVSSEAPFYLMRKRLPSIP